MPKRLNVLVIGNDGRTWTLCWKIRRSPMCGRLFCAPGNGGTDEFAENVPINVTEYDQLLKFALANDIDLTVVSPEHPLVDGLVDMFEAAGLKIFSPSKAAAQLEGSKAFAKNFMAKYKIPTAKGYICLNYEQGLEALRHFKEPVVKYDGLAGGKGVTVCANHEEAKAVLEEIFITYKFGTTNPKVIIEERLAGQEISVMALCHGTVPHLTMFARP